MHCRPFQTIASSVVCILTLLAMASAASAEGKTVERVGVFPPQIELTTLRDRQTLVVQAVYSDEVTRDVTAAAEFKLADGSLLERDRNTFYPAADGETTLTVTFEGHEIEVPVKVTEAAVDRPVSFRLDVLPVLAKAGCNTGDCHGSARGRDGFQLSLFGFDPDGDHFRITREQPGRRINLASPHDALIIQKALGDVTHTGGELFTEDSELYDTLIRWLENGAPNDSPDVAEVVDIQLMPEQLVLEGEAATQQMSVLAHYSDGTTRDVTPLTVFMSNNDASADVDEQGLVSAKKRGEAFILARFDAHTVTSQVIILPDNLDFEWSDAPEANYIDELIHAKLQKLRVLPSERASDEVFLRRVYLDIVGMVPEPEEVRAFLADEDPNKREKLVDDLLNRKEFVEVWVMKFAELLQIRSTDPNQGISYKASLLYYNWLSERLANEVPMDEVVQELIASNGSTFENPATNFYQVERENLPLTENVAQVFMGMRVQCAQCHNHPFDRWTMNDYYGFAAFFTQIGRKKGGDPRDTVVFNRGGGEVRHPVNNQVVQPKFLGGETPDLKGRDRRAVLADWIASEDNPYFATNLANIVWDHFFGQGITDPVDDVRVSNPPVNPALLRALGDRFIEYDYDFKRMVRDITLSETYQRSTQINETNATDETNFSRAYIRRVRAEVLYDVISQVTETLSTNKFRGLPQGARAVQIADGSTSSFFLTTFGRATRETVCSCEVSLDPNLSQALHLINGDTIHQKLQQGGVVPKLIEQEKTNAEILEDLYLRTFGRFPTQQETESILPQLDVPAEQRREVLEDLFWALLNSKEFMFNH
ncbi:MAG: DUF1549 domain-containing protein [Phycisphaeraceae bacterium]